MKSVYQQNIVIDLEFTQTPEAVSAQGLGNEIIEIGAVRVDAAGKVLDEFSTLVRPMLTDEVSSVVRDLTGIATSDVHGEDVPELSEALRRLAAWIGNAPARIVAWSESDRAQVEGECAFKDIEVPTQMNRWMDLQKVYPRVLKVGNGRKMALRVAADWCGVELDGNSAHRALYDAQVTAELLSQLMTGEWRSQKRALDVMVSTAATAQRFTTSLGNMCGELEKLLASMMADTSAAVAA